MNLNNWIELVFFFLCLLAEEWYHCGHAQSSVQLPLLLESLLAIP